MLFSYPFAGAYINETGDLAADILSDIAAEQRAKDTDIVVNVSTSVLVGVDESKLEQGSSSQVATDGTHHCPECGGAGGYNEQYFDQVMVNGRWQQIPKSRWRSCPVCGGSGIVD